MKKQLVMAIGAAALALNTGLVMAGDHRCDGPKERFKGDFKGGERLQGKMAERLGLTEEQQAKLDTLFATKKAERDEQKTARQDFRKQLDELDPASADYLANVKTLADQQAAVMADRMVKGAEFKAEVYAILTPEQAEKFEAMKDRAGKKFKKGGEKHHRD